MRVYIGYDPIDAKAHHVAEASLRAHASIEVFPEIVSGDKLRNRGRYLRTCRTDEHGQRYDDIDGKPFSTDFSFARFGVVPFEMERCGGEEWVLFTDPDVLWRADIAELVDRIDNKFAVMCVKHQHEPTEDVKMLGQQQSRYYRKNWSSVMLIKPNRCRHLTWEAVNNWKGADLHAMRWMTDPCIGGLPEAWNWLVGDSPTTNYVEEGEAIKLVHFTKGTPDMPHAVESPFDDEWWSYMPAKRASER